MASNRAPHFTSIEESSTVIDALVGVGSLGQFTDAGDTHFLIDDIQDVSSASLTNEPIAPDRQQIELPLMGLDVKDGDRDAPMWAFVLADGSKLSSNSSSQTPRARREVGTLLRHLLQVAKQTSDVSPTNFDNTGSQAMSIALPGGWTLRTVNPQLAQISSNFIARTRILDNAATDDFANTAYYMGTKRALTPVIAQACAMWAPTDAFILDLMCGSGAVSAALNRTWPVAASDAMQFCRVLATVQSAGFSEAEARATIEEVVAGAQVNLGKLTERIGKSLAREDEIFYSSQSGLGFRQTYRDFAMEFPTFPEGGISRDGWDPLEEVSSRQLAVDPSTAPGCLFTCYFSNVYFGLRQAVEIDSLRYSVSQVPDPRRRNWALGALVAAVSRIGTAYGGHFAQPFVPAQALLGSEASKNDRLVVALKQRTLSVWREFQARLLALGRASEEHSYAVRSLEGPWENALLNFNAIPHTGTKVVYVDAPYTRDEYSRYYHVLETLVKYNYPSAETAAKMPSKALGQRFASEFATRKKSAMTGSLAKVITAVLRSGHMCFWSYSDRASSSVSEVVSSLDWEPSSIRSVAAEHGHKSQGGHSTDGKVHEYVIMLWP